MRLFSTIVGKIFPSDHPVARNARDAAGAAALAALPQGPVAPAGEAAGRPGADAATPAGPPSQAAQPKQRLDPAAGPAPGAGEPAVDVGAVLAAMAARHPGQLDYQTSIVDLLKLLDLDSSLAARRELAHELGYTGDTGDAPAMNIWLHRQVMARLAEAGARVPLELRG